MKPRKRPKKDRNKASMVNSHNLLDYLLKYGEGELVQPAEASFFDSQIKNLSLSVAQELIRSTEGTIIDIGCGEGILLNRLSNLAEFVEKKDWIYFGTDFDDKLEKVMDVAIKNKIHRRVEVKNLNDFYNKWPKDDIAPRPHIIIIRNVFHEIDIGMTANLLFHLVNNFQPNDTLFVQDLMLFQSGERGNACWTPKNFNKLLIDCGFSTTFVEEPSKSGSRWFTIIGKKIKEIKVDLKLIIDSVISQRARQYEYWKSLGFLVPDNSIFRDHRIAKLDYDLQCAALLQQLTKARPGSFKPPTPEQQSLIIQKTFSKYLANFDLNSISGHVFLLDRPEFFRDRRNDQDWLEDFLRKDFSVAVIHGHAFIGKSALAKAVLARRSYEKHVVLIDVQSTSSIWNLIELYFSGIGCKLAFELISGLKEIKFNDIRRDVKEFIHRISGLTIVIFDHFERLLDPANNIFDSEIRDFICLLFNSPQSKIIITTRKPPNLSFIRETIYEEFGPRQIGRFPNVEHIENILDDFINRSLLGIDKYPDALLEAIDRHPYISVLAAMIIRKEGKSSLNDQIFLRMVRQKLREELLRMLVDEHSKPAIEILSLLRIPVPRKMVESLATRESLNKAYEDGLIYNIFDQSRDDLITTIGAFRKFRIETEDLDLTDDIDSNINTLEIEQHKKIAHWYEYLYRDDKDPRWMRELHYHTLVSGNASLIQNFGKAYRGEIFWAGNYWFLRLKKFREALWAFRMAYNLGLRDYFTQMRLASCLMRVGKISEFNEGEGIYLELINSYPDAINIKTSYIDSLLYLKLYRKSLDKLSEYGLTQGDGPWISGEYGRAYFGVHNYRDAVDAFETQLKQQQDIIVYDYLASTYHRIGETNDVSRILRDGLTRHNKSKKLKLRYASHLIRLGPQNYREAYSILEELYNYFPNDGRILQQYCKILCLDNNVALADNLWKKHKKDIYPTEYRIPILVLILIGKKQWKNAIKELQDIPSNDEHLVGMKKKVFLSWANIESEKEERKIIAKEGLMVKMDSTLETNIPLMVLSARLARIAEEQNIYLSILEKINKINYKISQMLEEEDEELNYLQDDLFGI